MLNKNTKIDASNYYVQFGNLMSIEKLREMM